MLQITVTGASRTSQMASYSQVWKRNHRKNRWDSKGKKQNKTLEDVMTEYFQNSYVKKIQLDVLKMQITK